MAAIFARFLSLRAWMDAVQSALGLLKPNLIPARSAETHDPMSPITGAAIATLLSISVGAMSIWMNFFGAPQVLPLPCASSQLRRAPVRTTTSAPGKTNERAAAAGLGWVSGTRPLGIHTRKEGMAEVSTSAR